MKKRLLSILLVIILAFAVLPVTALAAGSLSNFQPVNTYLPGQFSDVPASQWYADEVQLAYEYGLIDGKTETTFQPDSYLTIAEAIKLAAVMHSTYETGGASFYNETPWYQQYVNYCLYYEIIPDEYDNYETYATRADFAQIFANALPSEALPVINDIIDNSIPDVSVSSTYGPAVYELYRAGILTGSDTGRSFFPGSNIKRSEVAAITARMVSDSNRVSFTMDSTEHTVEETSEETPASGELTATEVATKCTPAVFMIEIYNTVGNLIGTGSGFFIDSSGLAVTNHHVIESASSAVAVMPDGTTYDVAGVYDSDENLDLALLQIDGSGFPYLDIGDSTSILTGSNIYAIGYPGGIAQTFTQGIITNKSYLLDGVNYILLNAVIAPGSSGGALVDSYGEVIGVTSASYVNMENLNLAVPIHLIQELSQSSYSPLSSSSSSQENADLHISSTAVNVTTGGETSVTITDISTVVTTVSVSVDDASIADCAWGDWYSNYTAIPLNIYGISAGTTTMTIYLLDEQDNILAQTTITVTVTGNALSTAYYTGFYPAPDFGAYLGIEPYDEYFEDGSSGYAYRVIDMPMSLEQALIGYTQLLEENGFSLEGVVYSDGQPISVYTNDEHRVSVWETTVSNDGYDFIVILVSIY